MENVRYSIKVDTEAIKRNGRATKDLPRKDYEPAIIVMGSDGFEGRFHDVSTEGVSLVMIKQDDAKPGAVGSDNRGARVWIEVLARRREEFPDGELVLSN